MTSKSKTSDESKGNGRRSLTKNPINNNERSKRRNDIIIRNILNVKRISHPRQNTSRRDKTSIKRRSKNKNTGSEAGLSCNNNLNYAPNWNIGAPTSTPAPSPQHQSKKQLKPSDHIEQKRLSRSKSGSKITTKLITTSFNNNRELPLVTTTTKVTEFSLNGCGLFGYQYSSSENEEMRVSGINHQAPLLPPLEDSCSVTNDERQWRISTSFCKIEKVTDNTTDGMEVIERHLNNKLADEDDEMFSCDTSNRDKIGSLDADVGHDQNISEVGVYPDSDAAECNAYVDHSHSDHDQGLKRSEFVRNTAKHDSNSNLVPYTTTSIRNSANLSEPRTVEVRRNNFQFSKSPGMW